MVRAGTRQLLICIFQLCLFLGKLIGQAEELLELRNILKCCGPGYCHFQQFNSGITSIQMLPEFLILFGQSFSN